MEIVDVAKSDIIEVICSSCFPYVCAYWGLPPLERLDKCKQLGEQLDKVIHWQKEYEGKTYCIGIIEKGRE